MTFMKNVLDQNIPIWEECMAVSFLREVKNKTLSLERLSGYMLQDCIYLEAYARIFGKLICCAADFAEIQLYYSGLSFVADGEAETRLRWKRLAEAQTGTEGIAEKPETAAYIHFLERAAERGKDLEMLMAVLPCMLSYSYIFRRMKGMPWLSGDEKAEGEKQEPDMGTGPGREEAWFEPYASEAYRQECMRWCAFADKKCRGIRKEEQKRLAAVFMQGSRMELDFWRAV